MHVLLELIAAVSLMMLIAAGAVVLSIVLWVRAQRRRARAGVERALDRLAEQIAVRLAAGEVPGWTLERYKRLAEDARTARTWGALQRLIWRERVLDEARAAVLRAPERWDALARSLRGGRRAPSTHR